MTLGIVGHGRLVALAKQIVVKRQGRLIVSGQFFIFLLDRRTGFDSLPIQFDLPLDLFLLFRSFRDGLLDLEDLRAQILNLRRFRGSLGGFVRMRRIVSGFALRNFLLESFDITFGLDDVRMVICVLGL